MPAIYDSIDARFSWNGDFNLSSDNDIEVNNSDGLLSLLDQIHSECASSLENWEIYPNKGAGLDDFIGEPNTRYTADRIHDRLRLALVGSNLVAEDDLEIHVIPVHIYKLLILVKINAISTPFNQLSDGELLQTAIVFDSFEQEIFFLDETPDLINV